MHIFLTKSGCSHLFSKVLYNEDAFSLNGTEYILLIRGDKLTWKKKVRTMPKADMPSSLWAATGRRNFYSCCDFEAVFENCPKNIRQELIYHLDLFQNNHEVQLTPPIPVPNYKNLLKVAR